MGSLGRGKSLALGLLLTACGSGGEAARSEALLYVPGPTATTDVFSDEILHYVELTVAPEHLATLVPFGEERVPCTLVYDGVTLEDVGLRLKGGAGSARPLGQKPGFSIKTNEFVSGRKLHGFKKLLLNNAVQDPSFLSEFVAYDLWKRAGAPARRSGHARVSLNGEYLGLYVVAEPYDDGFLSRSFTSGKGNLYEGGSQVDVTEFEDMELETNEDENDRSDLRALAAVLEEASDADLPMALEAVADVEAFLTYWAVESLVDHWDGYAGGRKGTSIHPTYGPNNYYAYGDPSTGLVSLLPHGADQCLGTFERSVLLRPSVGSRLAVRCFDVPALRARYVLRIREVLDTAWDAAAVRARLDAAVARIEGSIAEGDQGSRNAHPGFRTGVTRVREFVLRRAAAVRDELDGE